MFPISAQTDFLTGLLQGIASQYGTTIGLLVVVGFLLFLVLRGQLNAKTERDELKTLKLVEDTKRDTLISNLAEKQGETEQELRRVDRQLAESEGKVQLLNQQLNTERDNRQREREELKGAMRDLSEKLKGHEATIEELKLSLIGEQKKVGILIIERDTAIEQLSSEQAKNARLENTIGDMLKERDFDKAKILEQADQIKVLSYELVALLPPIPAPQLNLNDTLPLLEVSELESLDGTSQESVKPSIDISVTISSEEPKKEE